MPIYVDFDDVILDTCPRVVKILNKLQPEVDFKFSDLKEWDILDEYYKKENVTEAFKQAMAEPNFIPGSLEALQDLMASDHKIYVLTATSEENQKARKELFKHFLPWFPLRNLIFEKDKSKYSGGILIDDHDKNILGYEGQALPGRQASQPRR